MSSSAKCGICGCDPKNQHSLRMNALCSWLRHEKLTFADERGAEIKRQFFDGTRTREEAAKNARRLERRWQRDSAFGGGTKVKKEGSK